MTRSNDDQLQGNNNRCTLHITHDDRRTRTGLTSFKRTNFKNIYPIVKEKYSTGKWINVLISA